MRWALALFLAASLAGCGPNTVDADHSSQGANVGYAIDNGTSMASARIATDSGSAVMRSGQTVPVDLPGRFSLFPDATVITNTVFSHEDSKGAIVHFESTAEPGVIADFYRRQARESGVQISLEMAINGGQLIGGEGREGRTFTLNARPAEGRTVAQLTVGEKMGR